MSDLVKDLESSYKKNVVRDGTLCVRSVPVGEDGGGMFSELVSRVCGLLRGLAPLPAALLAVLWGHHSLLFRLLRHVDDAVNAIVFSSGGEEQRARVTRWLGVEGVQTAWRHGWLVCARLDGALPGVCAGHPRARISLHHAMTIAHQHLGLEPVFCREELEFTDSLTQKQEWKLVDYLDRLREELSKVSPGVSKATTPCADSEKQSYSLDYYAEGQGLNFAQTREKTYFTIYPTEQQINTPNEIVIAIHGPNDAYGSIIIPPVLSKTQQLRQKLLGLEAKGPSARNILTQGTGYFRALEKKDIRKTFFVPNVGINVDIDASICEGHAEICYEITNPGAHEISITSRGNPILGSPFQIAVANKIINDSKHVEDRNDSTQQTTEEKQVVLRIVDFITEKMILSDSGDFYKISNEKAEKLLVSELEAYSLKPNSIHNNQSSKLSSLVEKKGLKIYVNRILILLRVCKILKLKVQEKKRKTESYISKISNVPDILDSVTTNNQLKTISFLKPNNYPSCSDFKSISTKLQTNTSKVTTFSEMKNNEVIKETNFSNNPFTETSPRSPSPSSSNPFSEFLTETKNINDDVQAPPIAIVVNEDQTSQPASLCSGNPFIDPKFLERPKTPVLKIITGDLLDRVDSPYIRQTSLSDEAEEIRGNNEFLNPLFVNDYGIDIGNTEPLTADFIIGAPVSIPPVVRSVTPKPHMNAVVTVSTSDQVNDTYFTRNHCTEHTIFDQKTHAEDEMSTDATFYSTGSIDLKYSLEPDSLGSIVNSQSTDLMKVKRPLVKTQAKDTWDSAYVSIDEFGGSPETGNTTLEQNKISSIYPEDLEVSDLQKMGPAEKELWENLRVLNHSDSEILSEKERQFSTIIEEKDRSMPISLNSEYVKESDLVVAVDLDTGSSNLSEQYECSIIKQEQQLLPKLTNQKDNLYSASDLSDTNTDCIHRREPIFEVQNVLAERSYLSRTLDHNLKTGNDNVVVFGGNAQKSIVLERKRFWDEKIKETTQSDQIADFAKPTRSCDILQEIDELNKSKHNQGEEDGRTSFEFHNSQIINMNKKPKQNDLVNKWRHYSDKRLQIDRNTDANSISKKPPRENPKKPLFPVSCRVSFDSNQCESKYLESIRNDIKVHENKQSDITVIEETAVAYLLHSDIKVMQKDGLKEDNVFKAFETSPKRFFGQSRKNIITKIENCEISKPELNDVLEEFSHIQKGIVSKRIDIYDTKENVNAEQQETNIVWKHNKNALKKLNNSLVKKDTIEDRKALLDEIRTCWNEKNGCANINNSKILFDERNNEKISRISTQSNINTNSSKSKYFISDCNKQNEDRSFSYMNGTKHENRKKENNIPDDAKCPKIPSITNELTIKSKEHNKLNSNVGLSKCVFSKSEMDIFNKTKFHYVKSFSEEIPKVDVKSYINIFESTGLKKEHKICRSFHKIHLKRQNNLHSSGSSLEKPTDPENLDAFKNAEVINVEATNKSSNDNSLQDSPFSLAQTLEKELPENVKETDEVNIDLERKACKQSFKRAKVFFQSMDELRTISKSKQLNECELLLYTASSDNISTKSIKKHEVKHTKAKKITNKSHSAPCSENEFDSLSQGDNKENDETNKNEKKLVKISEKFQVEDLFNDVIGDRNLSRTGSFRGIPNKRAVLETFRSMENINQRLTSYDMAVTQLSQFAKENNIRNAQTHSTEYPYLPKTEPARYRSRCDVNASGLISRDDLLNNEKQRRYSVPDGFVLNEFTMRFTSSL